MDGQACLHQPEQTQPPQRPSLRNVNTPTTATRATASRGGGRSLLLVVLHACRDGCSRGLADMKCMMPWKPCLWQA